MRRRKQFKCPFNLDRTDEAKGKNARAREPCDQNTQSLTSLSILEDNNDVRLAKVCHIFQSRKKWVSEWQQSHRTAPENDDVSIKGSGRTPRSKCKVDSHERVTNVFLVIDKIKR